MLHPRVEPSSVPRAPPPHAHHQPQKQERRPQPANRSSSLCSPHDSTISRQLLPPSPHFNPSPSSDQTDSSALPRPSGIPTVHRPPYHTRPDTRRPVRPDPATARTGSSSSTTRSSVEPEPPRSRPPRAHRHRLLPPSTAIRPAPEHLFPSPTTTEPDRPSNPPPEPDQRTNPGSLGSIAWLDFLVPCVRDTRESELRSYLHETVDLPPGPPLTSSRAILNPQRPNHSTTSLRCRAVS